jgi:aspartate racemase
MNHSSKSIGIIGGMSWESSSLYYKAINESVKQSLGGLHSARIILNSLDFAAIESLQHKGDWTAAGKLMNEAALSLQSAGADFLLIATNTMHKVADDTMTGVDLPLLHIVDPTAEAIIKKGHQKIGLLGTGFTMSDEFYKGRMQSKHRLEVLTPNQNDQALIHRIIYEELCLGHVNASSRSEYIEVIEKLAAEGAEAVILGCTEITLLVDQSHTPIPLFDTTALHAAAAAVLALSGEKHG